MFKISRDYRHIELSAETPIAAGLYFGHAYCITINPAAVLGENINLHKGVTIGQENRGHRKGAPVIGNNVWISVNATIVGAINIGDDVLGAPNSYVNCDVPSHSVVFGNPCIIKHRDNATEGYAISTELYNHKIEDDQMKCVEVYEQLYHQEPYGVAFCPYRISPLGAHIDHQYGKINGLAINKGIHMTYHPKQNGVVELQSLNFQKRAQFFVNAVPKGGRLGRPSARCC